MIIIIYYLLWFCRECNGSGDEVEMMKVMLLMVRRFEMKYYFGELKKKGWKSQPPFHLLSKLNYP